MPFYRFEEFDNVTYRTPRLSTGRGPIIEGQYIYFSLNSKEPGTGSQVHYHPNELLIFPLQGCINALVGRNRRVVRPGIFIHIPPFGRHQMMATEDGPCSYLYVKDRTWTVVGLGADDAVPDRPQTVEEALKEYEEAGWTAGQGKAKKIEGQSSIRIDGLGNCYHPILGHLDEPVCSANRHYAVEGCNLNFCFSECITETAYSRDTSHHEIFVYVIGGSMDVEVDGEKKTGINGDIIHIPKGSTFRMLVRKDEWVRYVSVTSTERLEQTLTS